MGVVSGSVASTYSVKVPAELRLASLSHASLPLPNAYDVDRHVCPDASVAVTLIATKLPGAASCGEPATGALWSFASTSVAETFVTVGLARPTAVNQSNAAIASRPTEAGSTAQRRRPLLIAPPRPCVESRDRL